MRYLVGFVVVLALVASPLSVSGQDAEEGWVEEFYPELAPRESPQAPPPEPASEPTPGEPAPKLQLDDAGVAVTPIPEQMVDTRSRRGTTLRVRRARRGLISMGALTLVGGLMFAGGLAASEPQPEGALAITAADAVLITGMFLAGAGVVGMITTGPILGARKRQQRKLQQAHYGTPRRVQWDLARSRLVF